MILPALQWDIFSFFMHGDTKLSETAKDQNFHFVREG